MCMIELKRGNGAIDLLCDITGKPITITNNCWMYCSDMCDAEADASSMPDSQKRINSIIDSVEW